MKKIISSILAVLESGLFLLVLPWLKVFILAVPFLTVAGFFIGNFFLRLLALFLFIGLEMLLPLPGSILSIILLFVGLFISFKYYSMRYLIFYCVIFVIHVLLFITGLKSRNQS